MMERMKNIDVALVYGVWNEYVASVNDSDFERWMDLWAEDGIRMSPSDFGQRRAGKDDIRAMMQPIFDFYEQKIAISLEGVQIFGVQAYAYGIYSLRLKPKIEGETIALKGSFLTVLAKQTDGCWKIAIDCFNFWSLNLD